MNKNSTRAGRRVQLACALALALPAWTHAQVAGPSPAPVTRFEHDAQGNPTKVVQGDGTLNLATRMDYDSLQRLIRHTDPADGLIKFSYNGREDLTNVTDPRSLITAYALDGLAQRKSLQSPDTGTASSTYDAAGNLKSITDAGNVKISYSYDLLNRVTEAKHEQLGVASPPPPLFLTWTYDQTGAGFSHGVGRITTTGFPSGSRRYAYDAHGRLKAATQQLSQGGQVSNTSVGYAYNAAGGLTELTYPSGRVLTWTYENGQPRALSVTLTSGGAAVPVLQELAWASWSQLGSGAQWQSWNWMQADGSLRGHERNFDEWGRLTDYKLGGEVRTLVYDEADRIKAYAHQAGEPLNQCDFSGQNCTPLPVCPPNKPGCNGPTPASWDQSFNYDAAGRLIRAQQGIKLWTYAHDATGNRSTHSTPTVVSGIYSTDPNSNRLLSVSNPALSLTHDSIGSVKSAGWTANYNFTGHISGLTHGANSASYHYDSDARRVIKRQGAGGVVYVYGQQGELLGEYDLATGAVLREYLWLGSTPVAMIAKAQGKANAELFYLHADHIDTPRVATDRQGRLRWSWRVEPFGNEVATDKPQTDLPAVTQNLRFPGQVFDQESGLHYNHHRYYDPRTGRYVQSDPIGLAGGINTYSYVGGNPVSKVDPKGLFTSSTHNEITSAAISIAGSPCAELPRGVAMADWIPGSQAPRNAHWHAMRDGTNSNSTVETARRDFDQYVEDQSKSCSCAGLARALHAIQDSYARGHRNFQPWGGGLPSAAHVAADAYPAAGERDAAVQASVRAIRAYQVGCDKQCPR